MRPLRPRFDFACASCSAPDIGPAPSRFWQIGFQYRSSAPGETLSTQWVHTIDISQIGCRLGGLRTKLSPGETIAVQRGPHKVPFRVIWSRHLAANKNQAGIEALDYGRNIWAVELPLYPIAEDSIELSCATEDSSATASARSTPPRFIPVAAHPRMRRGLSFGLLLLSVALTLSLYQGRVAIQPPVPAPR